MSHCILTYRLILALLFTPQIDLAAAEPAILTAIAVEQPDSQTENSPAVALHSESSPTTGLPTSASPLFRFSLWCVAVLWLPWSVSRLIELILRTDSVTLHGLLVTAWILGLIVSAWLTWGHFLPVIAYATVMTAPLALLSTYFIFVCDCLDA